MADKPDFNSLNLPPMWTGVAGQGKDQIFSLGGKWHKAGDSIEGGYTVHGLNKNGMLAVSWNGLPITLGMNQGTVTPMETQQTAQKAITGSSSIFGGGDLSEQDKEMLKNLEGTVQNDGVPDDRSYKSIDKNAMDRIRENVKDSPHMTDEDKANILHYDEYMDGVKNNTLKKGIKYFVPSMQEDGNVDFHIFMDNR